MFPFVYILVFVINDCFQTQLCRLIRLRLYQFRKCVTRILVWTGFQRWILACIASSHEILPVLATALLPKEIQHFLITLFQPIACRDLICFVWKVTVTVTKSLKACLCHCDQVLTELQAPWLVSCLFIICLAGFVLSVIISVYYCNLGLCSFVQTSFRSILYLQLCSVRASKCCLNTPVTCTLGSNLVISSMARGGVLPWYFTSGSSD